MSDMDHGALGLIILIFHLARHMHDYSQTPAPPTGDLMITFAEQRSLSEKLRVPDSTQPLAGSLHLIDVSRR